MEEGEEEEESGSGSSSGMTVDPRTDAGRPCQGSD